MKKLAVILPMLFALCFAVLCGCGGGEASLFYNALSWNAAGEGPYLVYDGETLLAETDVPAVLLPRAGGRTVTVYRSENGERGKLLHTVQYDGPVYGEKVFCGSEELEGYVRDGAVYLYGAQHFVFDYGKKALDVFPGVVYVASDVKKLTFRSEGRVTVQADICIRARTDAFELELENVTLQGAGERHAAVSFDEGAEDTALILGLYGLYNAVLCGYNAEDGADGHADGFLVHGGNGGAGETGGSAVRVDTLLLLSQSDARFSGGGGGDGGNGGDASGLNSHGSGGRGGDGGSAIVCDKLEYFLLGTVEAAGGPGGKGGKEGSGGLTFERGPGADGDAGIGISAAETIAHWGGLVS